VHQYHLLAALYGVNVLRVTYLINYNDYISLITESKRINVFGRPTYVRINVAAPLDNFRQVSALTSNSKALGVIKADAYGHGAIAIALLNDAMDYFR
jgi:hypothetical protein